MNQRASAVIIKNGAILLIHRIKDQKEYWVIPGGSVEENETPELALDREVAEELSLKVENKKLLHVIQNRGRDEYHFLVTKYEGEPMLGGEEALKMDENDQYILTWIPLSELQELENFYPESARNIIVSLL